MVSLSLIFNSLTSSPFQDFHLLENNSMVMKMKLAKDAGDVVFDCPACEKKFHSVKALGGHKRVHVHVEKSNKRNHEAMESPLQHEAEKPSFSCPICPLAFPSEKSLHGHMRKHSDRGWRGMNPPPSPPPPPPASHNNSSSLVAANSHTHVCACGRSFTYRHAINGDAHNSPPPREGENARNPKRVLTFDLNQLPPPSSDDEN